MGKRCVHVLLLFATAWHALLGCCWHHAHAHASCSTHGATHRHDSGHCHHDNCGRTRAAWDDVAGRQQATAAISPDDEIVCDAPIDAAPCSQGRCSALIVGSKDAAFLRILSELVAQPHLVMTPTPAVHSPAALGRSSWRPPPRSALRAALQVWLI